MTGGEKVAKTIQEINEKIRSGSVVVFTAEEIIDVARKKGIKKAAREVDVVTTGTFSPMCSSGAFFNIKQQKEKMKNMNEKLQLTSHFA